jgi:hypothetical protein
VQFNVKNKDIGKSVDFCTVLAWVVMICRCLSRTRFMQYLMEACGMGGPGWGIADLPTSAELYAFASQRAHVLGWQQAFSLIHELV